MRQVCDAEIFGNAFGLGIGFVLILQTVPLAHFRQRGFFALICLHKAHARQMPPHQRHAAFDRRYGISLNTRHDVCAALAVVARFKRQERHVLRSRRLGNDKMPAIERLGVVTQDGGVEQARVQAAHRAVNVRDGREYLVILARQRLPHHQPAAVRRVGHALAGVNLQILLRQARCLFHV